MYSHDVYEKLHSWSEQELLLIRDLLPKMAPISNHSGLTKEERRTLGALLAATVRSTEAALLLVAYAQLWDAEIAVRSVLEGTLKFSYLLQGVETFQDRYREYASDLFRIGLFKDHAKYEELLSVVPTREHPKWQPLRERLLSDIERDEIATAFPKPVRSALEGRWGFTGLIGNLARSGDPLFSGITGLAAGYAMASHIVHADSIGVSTPLEIDHRPEVRRNAILLAHGARLMSDVMSCLHIRMAVGYRFVGHDPAPVALALEAIDRLKTNFDQAYEAWMVAEYGFATR